MAVRDARAAILHGDLAGAEALLLAALEATAALPDEAPEHAVVRNDLGVVYKYAARFDEAERLYRDALDRVHRRVGPDHTEAASIWHNLGGLAHARGDHVTGERHARHGLAIREAAVGPDHPDVAADLAALAGVVQEQGRLVEAADLHQRALAIVERHGADPYDVAVIHNNLGALRADLGDHTAAVDHYEHALALKVGLLGERHPDVALTLHNLGLLRADVGDDATACTLLTRALGTFEATLGADHPKPVACRAELTDVQASLVAAQG
jgi:tetratricopeptide (TPR) repeat protein